MNTLCHQMVIPGQDRLEANIALRCSHVHTHIFVCIFMYTYIYLCVCVCVCLCVIYLCMYLYVDISAVYIVCVHTYRPRPAGGHHPALRGAYSAVVVAATRPDAPESALKLCPPHPPGPRRACMLLGICMHIAFGRGASGICWAPRQYGTHSCHHEYMHIMHTHTHSLTLTHRRSCVATRHFRGSIMAAAAAAALAATASSSSAAAAKRRALLCSRRWWRCMR